MDREVDVLIVGGGLVGLAFACALKPARLSVTVLEAQAAPAPVPVQALTHDGTTLHSGFEARVSAINPASKAFLARVGGWPGDDRICAFSDMRVWDARGTAHIEFDAGMIGESALGYIVENRHMLASLKESADAGDIDTRFEAEIVSIDRDQGRYRVVLADGDTFICRLLVGADGGNSLVRKTGGIRTLRWPYGQDALVTTVLTEQPHAFTSRQCFTAIGPLAFLPLATRDQSVCSIVWSTDKTGELLELDDEALCARLTHASEQVLGKVVAVDKRYAFPLIQQHALAYIKPGLALIGDAAHVIHPLAGQGVNLGFADVHALSIDLGECRFTGTSPGDLELLRHYQRSRRPANILTASVMEGFRRLYGPDQPGINWLRNTGMRLMDGSGVVKSMVMKLACGR